MNTIASSGSPAVPTRPEARRWDVWFLLPVLGVLAIGWTAFGAVYYQRVLPFYDSLSYQESFGRIVQRTGEVGAWRSFIEVWQQGSNVALVRMFAAVFGDLLPASKEGLYLYLIGIHLAGVLTLVATLRRSGAPLALGVYAAAAWLAARPFKEAVNGVLDQRMDLASASFYLIVAALFFAWARRPDRRMAGLAGFAAALAVLHRPVMVVTVAGMMAIFGARAWWRHRHRGRAWWPEIALIIGPGLVLALPWLLYHAKDLRLYYLIWNVDVGSAKSMKEAAAYTFAMFGWATDAIYPAMVVVGLVWGMVRRRIDWLDFLAVVLCLALPLALLITSRSVGNFLVCQVPLGMPALALASWRRSEPAAPPERSWWNGLGPAIACGALVWIAGRSLHTLNQQIAGVPRSLRSEALQVVREIDGVAGGERRVMTGFQTAPVDMHGLAALALQEGINLQAGASYFHPLDFGITNAEAAGLSDEALQRHVTETLRALRGRSTLLLLTAAGEEDRLPRVPYSQLHARAIRAAVAADHELVPLRLTSPIGGIRFEVFRIDALR